MVTLQGIVAAWCTTEAFNSTCTVFRGFHNMTTRQPSALHSTDGCLVVIAQW